MRLSEIEEKEQLEQDRQKLMQWQKEINDVWSENVGKWFIEYIDEVKPNKEEIVIAYKIFRFILDKGKVY